jgi:nucleotide-binding universal stress UspA family protein
MGGSTAIEAEADRYLEDRVEELRHQGVAADSSPVAFLDPAEGILSAVVERGADAIVMSTRSRAGFERVVLGSVAHEVLRKARVPLVLVHPMSERPGVHGGVTAGAARAQT